MPGQLTFAFLLSHRAGSRHRARGQQISVIAAVRLVAAIGQHLRGHRMIMINPYWSFLPYQPSIITLTIIHSCNCPSLKTRGNFLPYFEVTNYCNFGSMARLKMDTWPACFREAVYSLLNLLMNTRLLCEENSCCSLSCGLTGRLSFGILLKNSPFESRSKQVIVPPSSSPLT